MLIGPRMVLAIAVTVLTACASTPSGPEFTLAPAPASNRALVYVYRAPPHPGFAVALDLQLNGRPLVALAEEGYTWLLLEPGKYRISAFRDNDSKLELAHPLEFVVDAGVTYRLYTNTSVHHALGKITGFSGVIPIVSNPTYIARVWTLRDTANDREALWALEGKRYQLPASIQQVPLQP